MSMLQIAVTLGTALLTQYAGTRFYNLPSFDPRSPLISALSLCLLLRTNDPAVAALASFIAIGSKLLIRWKDKHLFNPTNLALVVVLASGLGWISPGNGGRWPGSGFSSPVSAASWSPAQPAPT
jgi:Na+-transporting NADH:ubiquinone oxidoreductase subunit NqrB